MAITIQPALDLLTAYLPIQFELKEDQDSTTDTVQRACVEVFEVTTTGNVLKDTLFFEPTDITIDIADSSSTSCFCVDVSETIKDCLEPFNNGLAHLNLLNNNGYLPGYSMDFFISVTYKIYSSFDNILIDSTNNPQVSDTFTAVAIPVQLDQDPYLQDISQTDTFIDFDNLTKILTDMPQGIKQCPCKNIPLSIFAKEAVFQISAYGIEAFDCDGNSLGTEYYSITNEALELGSIFVGNFSLCKLQELRDGGFLLPNATNVLLIENGGFTLTNPTGIPINFADEEERKQIACIKVNFGGTFGVALPFYIQQSDNYEICFDHSCVCEDDKKGLTLHWLNCRSGVDTYTFSTDLKRGVKVTSRTAKKAIPFEKGSLTPINTQNVGVFKRSVNSQKRYTVKTKPLNCDLSIPLSGLFDSIEVYREDANNNLFPVQIVDIDTDTSQSKGKVVFNFTVIDSNCTIKQTK